MERELKVGQTITFFDEFRVPHDALVTAWWGPTCCNLIYVSKDPKKDDTWGNQIERQSSVIHKSAQAFGNFWCWTDEL